MWSWEKKPVDLTEKVTINTLELQLARSNNEVSELKRQISELTNAARSANFSFNFNAVKAFSVERNLDNHGLPVTIIGYLVPVVCDGKETFASKEWYLNCDEKQHDAIVNAFKESMK